jgi:hypothetical protein
LRSDEDFELILGFRDYRLMGGDPREGKTQTNKKPNFQAKLELGRAALPILFLAKQNFPSQT